MCGIAGIIAAELPAEETGSQPGGRAGSMVRRPLLLVSLQVWSRVEWRTGEARR